MNTVFCARRRGVSLIECVILVIVLTIAVGSFFTTLAVAQRNYTQHIQDKRAREVLFAWNQGFESKWNEGAHWEEDFVRSPDVGVITGRILNTIRETNRGLGYTEQGGQWWAGSFIVEVTPSAGLAGAVANGTIGLDITVRLGAGGKTFVNTARKSFNWYSTDTVSDDRVQTGG